ncbi:MAG: hypothetical protein AB7F88_09340 [Pyrinomonadaceae bacterium]
MPRIPNAFNFRVADQTVLDTSLFLNLYSPVYLGQLKDEDFTAPKLLILHGSPGSGKSSLLRLFETSTLIALCKNQARTVDNNLLTSLRELGVIEDYSPKAFGIYVHCDSSLRDIENLNVSGANDRMLNTLLDIRITSGFLRSIEMLNVELSSFPNFEGMTFQPLPDDEIAPAIFSTPQTFSSLRESCRTIERDFATFLNSFPGEDIPSSIKTHSKLFSIPYLNHICRSTPELQGFLPIVMLDDLHELYKRQRDQISEQFLSRSAIPRWVAVRKNVYELERLIDLEDANDGRDFREMNLDSAPTPLFRKFVNNVGNRRLRISSDLQPYNVDDFGEHLLPATDKIPAARIQSELTTLCERISELSQAEIDPVVDPEIFVDELVGLEARLILLERHRNKVQQSLFGPSAIDDAEFDGKVREAARLFASKRFRIPYYCTFDTLADSSTGNVEQFLSIASPFVDKIISRAELNRPIYLQAEEQQKLIRASADRYFELIDRRFDRGYAIKQLVDNLGGFFHAVTYRPNAPIAPGVNGFGFERKALRLFLESDPKDKNVTAFREVLTRAVAGNVLFVKETKQGQAGTERVVFYINRLLCVKYQLPLSTGGWQNIKPELLIEMMRRPISPREWGKRWVEPLLGEEEVYG